jgi:hypothetical protein
VSADQTQSGGCLCGAVRYRVNTTRSRALVCHCRDCQKQSGSAFSLLLALPAADVTLDGALASYECRGDSGRVVQRRFCPRCGSPVLSVSPDQPERVAIKAGTLDEPERLTPRLHIWCERALPWVVLPTDVPRLARQSA